MEKESMDVEINDTTTTNTINDIEADVEKQLVAWFSGQNPNMLQIGADNDDDLNRFCDYMKAVGPGITAQLLPQLLGSPYLRQLRPPRRIANCTPCLYFRAIHAPYVKQYRALIKQYKLGKFILPYKDGDSFKLDAMRHSGDGASDIYLCFIKFGSFYAVNLLSATTVATTTCTK